MGPFQRPLWYHTKQFHGLDFQPIHWVFKPLWEDVQPISIPIFFISEKTALFFRRRLRWCRYSSPLLELVASRVQQRLSSGQIVPSSSMRPKQWVFTLYKIVMVGEYFPFGWVNLSTYHYPIWCVQVQTIHNRSYPLASISALISPLLCCMASGLHQVTSFFAAQTW